MKKENVKLRISVIISILAIIFLVFILGLSAKYISKTTGLTISNKDCESSIKLYINTNKPEIVLKNLEFMPRTNVEVFNCADNFSYCSEKGISVFPSWEIDGQIIEKDINQKEFEELSNCKI